MQKPMCGLVLASGLFAITPARAECLAPPPAVKDLQITRFYADSAGSVVDPGKLAQHGRDAAPLKDFLNFVDKQADGANSGKHDAANRARCGLDWLKSWAQAGALLGKIDGAQAQSERKWDLAGAALAYLKLKRSATPDDRTIIEPWLIKIADGARAVFDDPSIKRNNHWYWLGLGLAATARATGSERHWQMADGIMADAARDIAADGTLPQELSRKARALHYHAFSLTALVALAELGAAHGENWYALNDGALHRLVALTAKGLADPAVFDKLAGVSQERPVNPGGGWLTLYRARFADRPIATGFDQPAKHRWLGGDVTVLKSVLTTP